MSDTDAETAGLGTDGGTGIDSETDDAGTDETEADAAPGPGAATDVDPEAVRRNTPGRGVRPEARPIDPDAPEEFGLVQVWWGDGKGKTTAALGMAFRAAGHGFRVHVLQFLKGGADSVEAVRGEYNAIAAVPGLSYENLGHYGWAGMADGSDDADHAAAAEAGLERARELIDAAAAADRSAPFDPDAPPEAGVHMLVLDEILYAVSMGLLAAEDVVSLVDGAPAGLELVLTGSHEEPTYLLDHADLVTEVRKSKHPMDAGQRARRGTEY
jgi:cob(I)alamin adenosyltransferase